MGPAFYKGAHSGHKLLDLREQYVGLEASMGTGWKSVEHRAAMIEQAEVDCAEPPKESSSSASARPSTSDNIHTELGDIIQDEWNKGKAKAQPKKKAHWADEDAEERAIPSRSGTRDPGTRSAGIFKKASGESHSGRPPLGLGRPVCR